MSNVWLGSSSSSVHCSTSSKGPDESAQHTQKAATVKHYKEVSCPGRTLMGSARGNMSSGFRPGKVEISLISYRDLLES